MPPAEPPVRTNDLVEALRPCWVWSSESTAFMISLPRKWKRLVPAPSTGPAERLPAWESLEQ